MDSQGPEAVRRYSKPDLRVLIDSDNLLGEAFGFKAIPNGIFVNADGTIASIVAGGFYLDRPEIRAKVEGWLSEDTVGVPSEPGGSHGPPEAVPLVAAAAEALRSGDRDTAARLLRQAWSSDPDNLIIRKQIWAIENPERFYSGEIDNNWQREQIERGL